MSSERQRRCKVCGWETSRSIIFVFFWVANPCKSLWMRDFKVNYFCSFLGCKSMQKFVCWWTTYPRQQCVDEIVGKILANGLDRVPFHCYSPNCHLFTCVLFVKNGLVRTKRMKVGDNTIVETVYIIMRLFQYS